MYRCLEKEMDETEVDAPVAGAMGTIRRMLLAQFLILQQAYLDDSRWQDMLRRLNDRMDDAAGTYESRIGLEILP